LSFDRHGLRKGSAAGRPLNNLNISRNKMLTPAFLTRRTPGKWDVVMLDAANGCLPANVLVDLYVRLRDEIGSVELSLDPNHKLRAPIGMAILAAAELVGSDIAAIEMRVREKLRVTSEPVAA
jgi:hypothetical protein